MEIPMTIVGAACGAAWRRRRFLALLTGGSTVLAVVAALLIPPLYRASVLLVPNQTGSSLSAALGDLTGLAGQFGISTGGEDPSRLFPEILQSRSLTHAILRSKVTASDSTSAVYLDWLGVDGATEAQRLEKGTKLFQMARSRVVLNPKNSSVKVVVFDRDPLVAAGIANRMASELDRLNQEIGRKNAREKRVFIEERRREVLRQLEADEEELTSFRVKNRNYIGSPQLVLEFERISRRVRLDEELALTLARELEIARIDEYKDVPVINVLDRALAPAERHSPRRAMIVIATFTISLLVGLALVLAWDGRRQFWSSFTAPGTTGMGR
ncbi:MAG: hypothetical protein IPK64_10925 [bacterium]|nr:hypothetical protein [bacterium]